MSKRLVRIIGQKVTTITGPLLLAVMVTVATASADNAPPQRLSSSSTPVTRSLPLLVDVGADQCIPCKMMAPILEDLKKEYTRVLRVEFVDAWKNPDEARKYRVRGIPTQIFYDASGKELGRHMGFISKEDILKKFKQLEIPLRRVGGK